MASSNDFGIATLSLGSCKYHDLPTRLKAASKAGFRAIDLFDDDWAAYLAENGLDAENPWEPTQENLRVAKQLGDLVKDLGMYICCTQALRLIEGVLDSEEREQSFKRVAQRFPFMRAFDTDLVFMCSNIRTDQGVTHDYQIVARDLRQIGDMAAEYARKDGGKMIKVGVEPLSWGRRNTWMSVWEVVRAANRPNVGLVMDTFNLLAVEFADPYADAGHGLLYDTREEAMEVLSQSLSSFISSVPKEKIFFFQVADGELVDPKTFERAADQNTPRLLPWSRNCRLFPAEYDRGAYLPIEVVVAAILAAGYSGPLSLEVFNKSLLSPDKDVPESHAKRGFEGLEKLRDLVKNISDFQKK